jgi:hypothetical protein
MSEIRLQGESVMLWQSVALREKKVNVKMRVKSCGTEERGKFAKFSVAIKLNTL